MNKKQPINYYQEYKVLKKRSELKKLELKLLDSDSPRSIKVQSDIDLCYSKMDEIENAIETYVPDGVDTRTFNRLSDERMFLECRYLMGMTMEQTAEAMYISRDTAYRIRRRIVNENPQGATA
ncbi:MAG: hypothetical protein FWB93_03440 [Oscillospiraceae bacterium]|nr:hypothetical protein [Oscillospiraceae bacterium]